MKRMRQYFQRHRFVYWLVLVAINFVVYRGGALLFGPPPWFFVVGMSLAMPTAFLFILSQSEKH